MEPNNNLSVGQGITILEQFEANVLKAPENIAVVENGTKVSYEQLYNKIITMATKIDEGSDPEIPYVAILLPQGSNFIAGFYGGFKTNRTPVPIDIGNSPVQIGFILEELGSPLLITAREFLSKVPNYQNVLLVSKAEVSKSGGIVVPNLITSSNEKKRNEVAIIMYTSGSTGKPKGVKISHNIMFRFANSPWTRNEISKSDRSLAYSSPSFLLSLSEYIPVVTMGGAVYVPPIEFRHDLDKLHEYIIENDITLISMPTSAAIKMIDRPMPTLRYFRISGEKLTVPINGEKTFKMMYVYGSSETFTIAYRETFESGKIPNNGNILPTVTVVFLDENLQPVKTGEQGEICAASPMVTEGYLNRPEITAAKYIKNPLNPDQIIYRTGDLGYLNDMGELVVTGRADFQVKIMGHRIEIGQVEFALSQHPAIKYAAVIAIDKGTTKSLSAFCVPEKGSVVPDLNSLCQFLENHLPRYGFPSQLTILESIPMTTSGKFNRQALKDIKVTKVIDPLATPTEIEMAKIWADTLKIPVEEIGRVDTFFSLGGNSLQLALVVTKLQVAPWFLNIRVRHLFKFPRLDEFSALIDSAKTGNLDLAEIIKPVENLFTEDLLLDEDFPEKVSSAHNTGSAALRLTGSEPTQVLLTGVTGYVGANFLHTLLERTNAHVYCITRAKNNAGAETRLEGTLKKYGINISPSILSSRVSCLAGDVSKFNFSLRNETYRALCTNIQVIFHFAAEVHFLRYYSELRESNVGGTKRVLAFCVDSTIKTLHYISTFSVVGGACPDTEVLEGPEPLFRIDEESSKDMGYSQSKRVAEKLVWTAIGRGLPACVYRLGEIGAHSKIQIVNRHDFLARLFVTCKEIGFYPMIDRKLPYGSIDFTCETILSVADQGPIWHGQGFHLFEKQISYLDGFREVNDLVALDSMEWVKKLASIIQSSTDPTKQEDYSILLQLIQNMFGGSSVLDKIFSNENLVKAVTCTGQNVNFNPEQNWKRYLNVLFD